MKEPEVIFKTKIFHIEFHNESGKCCIYWQILGKPISLSLILIGIYEFFLGNNRFGYQGEPLALYKKNIDLFNQKCQEYTRKYASDKYNKHVYVLEGYCDSKKEFDDRYLFYNFMNGCATINFDGNEKLRGYGGFTKFLLQELYYYRGIIFIILNKKEVIS